MKTDTESIPIQFTEYRTQRVIKIDTSHNVRSHDPDRNPVHRIKGIVLPDQDLSLKFQHHHRVRQSVLSRLSYTPSPQRPLDGDDSDHGKSTVAKPNPRKKGKKVGSEDGKQDLKSVKQKKKTS